MFLPLRLEWGAGRGEVSKFAIEPSRNATYVITKETERQKYRPGKIVAMMQKDGFKRFNMHEHTEFWKAEDAKKDGKGFGVLVEDCWYWYEPWLDRVRAHCKQNEARYK